MSQDRILLTGLTRELRVFTGQEPPTYRQLYMKALDDRLGAPVERINGQLSVERSDLPAIAAAVGMVSVPATSPQAEAAHRALAEVA